LQFPEVTAITSEMNVSFVECTRKKQ